MCKKSALRKLIRKMKRIFYPTTQVFLNALRNPNLRISVKNRIRKHADMMYKVRIQYTLRGGIRSKSHRNTQGRNIRTPAALRLFCR